MAIPEEATQRMDLPAARDDRTGRGTGRSSRSGTPAGRTVVGSVRRPVRSGPVGEHSGDDAVEGVALIGVELGAEGGGGLGIDVGSVGGVGGWTGVDVEAW